MPILNHNRLSFSFPEIEQQLQSRAEIHLQKILPDFALPPNPYDLIRDLEVELIESDSKFRIPMDRTKNDKLYAKARSLTQNDVTVALRDIMFRDFAWRDSREVNLSIELERTLRIPDDGKIYPLPAGLGSFLLRSVDDFPDSAPEFWMKRGGVVMPMYQSEALWISFSSSYPIVLKIGSGKIDAISGEAWTGHLDKKPQNYVVVPEQPWLDGFNVGKGIIRQFVAMPLGSGHTVEEQLTGKAEVGGIQLQAYPMSSEIYFREKMIAKLPDTLRDLLFTLFEGYLDPVYLNRNERLPSLSCCMESMGLGMGGKMRQEIYRDSHKLTDWDQTLTSRCFVHLCNSMVWRQITGKNPPHPPFTANEYKTAGIPWFDYYRDDLKSLRVSKKLAGVKSIAQLDSEKSNQLYPEKTSITPTRIIQHGNTRRPREIREFLDAP